MRLICFVTTSGWGTTRLHNVRTINSARRSIRSQNSIAIIVKHMAGNMRSRWRNFLTTDGEKPDRQRDTEFEDAPATRAEIVAIWDAGWNYLFEALTSLTDADLSRTITIRTEPHSVTQAINRQIAHYSYHVGQIVFLARHFAGSDWRTLTIAKKKSGEFNAQVASGQKSQRCPSDGK